MSSEHYYPQVPQHSPKPIADERARRFSVLIPFILVNCQPFSSLRLCSSAIGGNCTEGIGSCCVKPCG
jgi:hypothetical protein